MLAAVFFTTLLIAGWRWRAELPWTSEHGIGYWLGITGLSCVGLLLVYPFRKRIPALRAFGTVPTWFRLHMFLGVLAPVLILFHSKFSLGSANANVALACMLIVAGSGIIGRFLYVRIHRGVAGKKQEARRLLAEASRFREILNEHFADAADQAENLEDTIGKGRKGLFRSFFRAIRESHQISAAQARMLAAVNKGIREMPLSKADQKKVRRGSTKVVKSYCESLRAASQLEVFERLFSLWHVAHLPLFFLMVLAAVIHVFAVHQY